mgnify:FL=1
MLFPSPHPGIINFFIESNEQLRKISKFPSPHPGIINFFHKASGDYFTVVMFPSPHPGIINFFGSLLEFMHCQFSFRPLIRGLSISSKKT